MSSCPNCGRNTARTKDWACQWCGYPLLSGRFKKIPKTFKQLRDEELRQSSEVKGEPVPVPEPEPEPVPDPEPEPLPVGKSVISNGEVP